MKKESVKIEEIFRRPISRKINTVVKVEQEDREIVQQELEEYILTSSLEKNFSGILDQILDTSDIETDEIGVWISGFFGSGKSHFMKILGYILENKNLPSGDYASEIFEQRTEDEMLKAALKKINKSFDSEVLMFQIGSKENKSKTESICDIILREFNKMRGYAETPWVAEIEKNLEREDLYIDFRNKIKEITGKTWEEERTVSLFVKNNIKRALIEIDSDFNTKEEAGEAIDNVQDNLIINSEKLAEEINQYLKKKENDDIRFFVFLDEISQFISGDENKLLELQSISEDFGRIGKGKMWLGVTSQEKLKELVPGILTQTDQISKVMDRFKTRVNLTSEEIDRVVRERVLKKSEEAYPVLKEFYDDHSGRVSTHYKIDSSRSMDPLNEDNFIQCYPFLPYELNILPDIFAGLRGKSGEDQLTGRERTMIDVIHSVFNEPTNFRERKLGSFVTLDLIFEEIKEEITDDDVATIQNVSISEKDDSFARKVLKILYLLQQLSWVPNTAKNIATGLYGKVGDTSGLDKKVKETLEELRKATYVDISEEGYRFLSQTERSLMDEIESVNVRPADIRRRTKKILGEIFEELKTFNYSNHTSSIFDITIEADKEVIFEKGDIKLKILSPIHQLTEEIDIKVLKTKSHNFTEEIYWVAEEDGADDLEEDIKRIFKIEHTVNEKYGENLSPEEKDAVDKKSQDVERLKEDVRKQFLDSFKKGTLIYLGEDKQLNRSGQTLEDCVKETLNKSIPRVYTQLEHGLANIHDNDIKTVFDGLSSKNPPKSFDKINIYLNGGFNPNAPVCKKVEEEIKEREREGEQLNGKELIEFFTSVPYGWDRNVIKIALAILFRNGSIIPRYQEKIYADFSDPDAENLFMNIRTFNKTFFEEQESVSPDKRKKARDLLHKLFDKQVKDTVSDVKNGIKEAVDSKTTLCERLLPKLEDSGFPLSAKVDEFKIHLNMISKKQTHARVIQEFLDLEGVLEDLNKVVKDIKGFEESGKLEKYDTYKKFLKRDWKNFVKLSSKSKEIEIEDDLIDAADRLKNTLDSEVVIDNWTEAKTDHNKIAKEYVRKYRELYQKRRDVYEKAVEEVKSYGKDIDEEDIGEILSELKYREGEEKVDVDISKGEHIGLNPSFERLDEHIRTVDSYISEAKEKIDDIRKKNENDVKMVTVPIKDIISVEVVKDEDDLEKMLNLIRKELEEILETEDEVEIRFR